MQKQMKLDDIKAIREDRNERNSKGQRKRSIEKVRKRETEIDEHEGGKE